MDALLLIGILIVVVDIACLIVRWLVSSTPCNMKPDLHGKVYVITGCGSGIGRAAAAEVASLGATVIMANRAEDRSEKCLEYVRKVCPEAVERMHHITCDLSDLKSVHAFVDEFLKRYQKLDVLLNIAAYMDWYRKPEKSPQGLEMHFATNFLGHFALNLGLRPALAAAHGRIVNVGSCSYILDNRIKFESFSYEGALKNNHHGLFAYAHSKICITAMSHVLADMYRDDGILVVTADPGVCRSEITRRFPRIIHELRKAIPVEPAPHQADQTPLYCAWEDRDKLIPGEVYRNCHHLEFSPDRVEHNKEMCNTLYETASELVKKLY